MKALVIGAIFALGIAVGCSQKDVATATAVPEPLAPTATATMATATTATATLAATDPAPDLVATDPAPDPTVVQPMARQTSRAGRGFVPLDNPSFIAADETEYFGDEELVLGVEFAGEVRAYPVRMLRYHHVVNDTVRGEPLLVTY